ncbi:class I SAM-dependent methyltransferase [soil metagenome]
MSEKQKARADESEAIFATAQYGDSVETHPFHSHFERPATVEVLPVLAGLHVLDAGCATGWYTEYLALQGAQVTALDLTPAMVEKTQARVPTATVIQADLLEPLPFSNESFDLVLSTLTLHYLENWQPTFAEFQRVLNPSGLLVFSVHHPFKEFDLSGTNYFEVEKRVRTGAAGTFSSYRRPISAVTETLHATGFGVERLLEPVPTPAYREADPEGFAEMSCSPSLLLVRARRT